MNIPKNTIEPRNELDMANARLIAAAPDLLEACKVALECAETGNPYGWRNRLAGAIAKAEGTVSQ